jgi:hypothetical protein
LRYAATLHDPAVIACWTVLVVALPACFLPWGSIAALAALVIVVLLPCIAVGRVALGLNAEADLIEMLGFSIAGAALAILTAWIGAMVFGVSRTLFVVGPGLVACCFVTIRVAWEQKSRVEPVRVRTPPVGPPRRTVVALCMVCVVIAALSAVAFLPYGLERSDGVHHMGMTDWHKHLVVATALTATDSIPPRNPFLYPVASGPYYYGFQLLGAAVTRASGGAADVFQVMFCLTLVIAAAFPLVLFILARGLTGSTKVALVTAIGGTLLGGFDMVVLGIHAAGDIARAWPLPDGIAGLRAAVPSTQLDFWAHHNERCFNPPYVATIWAPQHMLAVLISLLVIHSLRARADRPDRPAYGYVLPAVMLAALPAISAYVALALVVGACMLMVFDAWRDRRLPWHLDSFSRWGYTGLIAALPAAPILYGFGRMSDSGRLTVHVSSAGGWQNGAVATALLGDHQWSRILDTPVFLLMELGIIGLAGGAGVWLLWRQGGSRAMFEASVLIATMIVLVTFVRPPVDGPNNLFARPMLIVWSLLAVFAAEFWVSYCEKRRLCWALVIVCAAAVPYAALGVTLEGALFWPTPGGFIDAARTINSKSPIESVVAIHPDDESPAYGYWLRRRQVATYERVALLFGATAEDFEQVRQRLREAYESTDPETAAERFGELGSDIVILDRQSTPRLPTWARLPCFELQQEGVRFYVYRRLPACVTTGGG